MRAGLEVSLERRLDEYLSESVTAAMRRERSAFDELARPYERNLVLFGAGGFGRRTLAGLRRAGIEPRAFCDNRADLWGRDVEGVPVYSPQDAAARYGDNSAFVVTIWNGQSKDRMAQRVRQLRNLGCDRVIPVGFLFWKFAETFLPYYTLDLPHKLLERSDEARAVFDFWADDESCSEYVGQIAFRLHLDYDLLGWPSDGADYFPSSLFKLTRDDTLIDCGAFDGDTIRSFHSLHGTEFQRVIGFEPDPLNWVKLQETLAALPEEIRTKVIAYPYAVGDRTCTVCFNLTGTELSTMGSGDAAVPCVKLDEILAGESPTLMKFDIEGAELAALEGGRETIRRHHPILAVSAYHLQSHLWEVPSAIRGITPDYQYFLRPQATEGWDLVCYAAPSGRLRSGGIS